jgi:transposase-like protein
MLLDGHTAGSVCERLGLSSVNLLYNWKRKLIAQGGPAAISVDPFSFNVTVPRREEVQIIATSPKFVVVR